MKFTAPPPETAIEVKQEIEESIKTQQEQILLPEKRSKEEDVVAVPDLVPIRHAQQIERQVREEYPEALRVVEALTEAARKIYEIPGGLGTAEQAYDKMRTGLFGIYRQSLATHSQIMEGPYEEVETRESLMNNMFHKLFPPRCPITLPIALKKKRATQNTRQE